MIRSRPLAAQSPGSLAVAFCEAGTTRIGKYVIDHSFIFPGLINVSTSCIAGYLLVSATKLI